MTFDESEYERRIQGWETTALPMFRIEDWQGTWHGSASGALLTTSRVKSSGLRPAKRSTRSITMARTVVHRQPDSSVEIRVISSRPDPDNAGRTGSALTNMAMQIVKRQHADGLTAEEHNHEVFALADRLRAGEYPWTTAVLVIDGSEIEFEVLEVGDVWAAFGDLNEDVSIDMQGHDMPFTTFRLAEFVGLEPTGDDEDARWSTRAERFLMFRGRWVPNWVHGVPTWFGNRKAGGLRGIPEDLAYLRDSILRRDT